MVKTDGDVRKAAKLNYDYQLPWKPRCSSSTLSAQDSCIHTESPRVFSLRLTHVPAHAIVSDCRLRGISQQLHPFYIEFRLPFFYGGTIPFPPDFPGRKRQFIKITAHHFCEFSLIRT
jgi:hypothetical protein